MQLSSKELESGAAISAQMNTIQTPNGLLIERALSISKPPLILNFNLLNSNDAAVLHLFRQLASFAVHHGEIETD